MVNADARAWLDGISALSDPLANHVAGDVTIFAEDAATINADSTLSALASAQNDYGVSIGVQLLDTLLTDYQFTSRSGSQTPARRRPGGRRLQRCRCPSKVYQYQGADNRLRELGIETYSTSGDWEECCSTSCSISWAG